MTLSPSAAAFTAAASAEAFTVAVSAELGSAASAARSAVVSARPRSAAFADLRSPVDSAERPSPRASFAAEPSAPSLFAVAPSGAGGSFRSPRVSDSARAGTGVTPIAITTTTPASFGLDMAGSTSATERISRRNVGFPFRREQRVIDSRVRSGGPPGERNGQYRHGERTKGAIAERQKFSALLKMLRAGLT